MRSVAAAFLLFLAGGCVTAPTVTQRPLKAETAAFTLTGRIAVKVINHLGDEVMKVFRVG